MNKTESIFDAWLVLQYKAGSKKATSQLVKRWHGKLCRQAYWYTKDHEVAKDIAQDAWGVILMKLHLLKDESSFGSWALRITTRKALDWHRKQKIELKHLKSEYDDHNRDYHLDNDYIAQDTLALMRISIGKLPIDQQLVLKLFYLEEFSIKEVADILNISTGTVKSRLFTAREKLKLILKNRNYEK